MDNLSQPETEKDLEIDLVTAGVASREGADIVFEEPAQEGSDVEFDESMDLTKIQEKLKEHMVEIADESEGENGGVFISDEDESLSIDVFNEPKNVTEADLAAKKYVIYIDSENIEYMESLSADERKAIVNDSLKTKKETKYRKAKEEQRMLFTSNVIVIAFTVIIFFPILFYVVNKSTELTILNYNQAKENFVKLYKQQGKIKQTNDFAPDDSNY